MISVDYMKMGSLIEKLRKEIKVTQNDVAKEMGVSKSSVCLWEAGQGIKVETAYKLAKFYNITVSELLSGKLDNESNEDYWRRNYDISNYDFDEIIEEDNLNKLEEFFYHVKLLKKRFFELLPKWANNKISKIEIDEFDFINKYIEFDFNFLAYKKDQQRLLVFIDKEENKKNVANVINKYKVNSLDYNWEIEKLYKLKFDLKVQQIYESGSLKALSMLLDVMNQVQKDDLLDYSLKQKRINNENEMFGLTLVTSRYDLISEEDIENNPFFKVMLNSGCNCRKINNVNDFISIDDDNLEYLEGYINEVKIDNYPYQNSVFETNSPLLFEKWKILSYEEYMGYIDFDRTNFYRDIVNLKDSNPLQYYKNYIKREDQ